jgi:hypothetical protein
MSYDDQLAIVRRIFVAASLKYGSAGHFAQFLGISQEDLAVYLAGKAMPPEDVLVRAAGIIIDELDHFRHEFAEVAWAGLMESLSRRRD